ncbi:MAG: GNAT family N-acetyltransferase [Spirochaetaceae bacterium]
MNILEWDSDFFGMKVAQEELTDQKSYSLILSNAIINRVQLLYLYSNFPFGADVITNDIKITYKRLLLPTKSTLNSNVEEYGISNYNESILPLVYQSGVYSRFYLDSNISNEKYYEMYKQWFLKSINKVLADIVYVVKIKSIIVGFITLKAKDKEGVIGLLAIDEQWRGYGIARDLLNKSFEYFISKGIVHVEVVTQGNNKAACNFYEKNGFLEVKKEYIHHLWVEKEK